eukprot:TRINITY_DN461_c0_g2_i2.p1 TRINITY_DN461_c0_g2~~TRINITY_DN461_c0_g2_i2.p1  ORF type:complete len:322 (-),score=23.56 TRINITY_DN461_c0_g2_i2:318-1283(-)
MTTFIKAIIFYIILCFVFVNVGLLILYFFFRENVSECLFPVRNDRVNLSKLNLKEMTYASDSVLFALILSSQKTQKRRKAVRDTWTSSTHNLAFNYVFVLSHEEEDESLLIEKDLYQDIVVLPDAGRKYRDLSGKMLYGIIYCHQNFNYKYLLKTDDDSFINVAALLTQIEKLDSEYNSSSALYAGKPMNAINIFTRGKLADPRFQEVSHLQKYPPYMQGGGYILSRSITEYITQTQQKYGLQQTVSEDATMGMWMLSLNVTKLDWSNMITVNLQRGKETVQNTNRTIDICRQNPPQVIVHRVSEDVMHLFYKRLQQCVNS